MSVRRQIDERIEALFREARGVADDTNVIPEMRRRMWQVMRLCTDLSAVMGGNWTETEKTGINTGEDSAAK